MVTRPHLVLCATSAPLNPPRASTGANHSDESCEKRVDFAQHCIEYGMGLNLACTTFVRLARPERNALWVWKNQELAYSTVTPADAYSANDAKRSPSRGTSGSPR